MRPIWVFGHRKCGTTLLTNLLDGHNSLINYGSDLRLIYAIYNGFKNYGDSSEVKKRFFKVFDDDRTDRDFINQEFIKDVVDELDFSNKDFVWQYLGLLNKKILKDFPNKRLFIKETSSELYINSIKKCINPQFIYVTRDPRDNWAAISAGVENYYSKLGEESLDSISSLINRVNFGFNAYTRSLHFLGNAANDIMFIKFEDLTKSNEESMQNISNFLDIDFETLLCNPTRNNFDYGGNSHDEISFKGVSSKNIGKFEERVNRSEIAIIEALCKDVMLYFNYEPVTSIKEQVEALEDFYSYYNQRYFFYDKYK